MCFRTCNICGSIMMVIKLTPITNRQTHKVDAGWRERKKYLYCIHDLKRDTFTFVFSVLLCHLTLIVLWVWVLSGAEEYHILSIIIFNCQTYKGEYAAKENVLHNDINHIHSEQFTMQQHEICWRAASQFNCLTFHLLLFQRFYFWQCGFKKLWMVQCLLN